MTSAINTWGRWGPHHILLLMISLWWRSFDFPRISSIFGTPMRLMLVSTWYSCSWFSIEVTLTSVSSPYLFGGPENSGILWFLSNGVDFHRSCCVFVDFCLMKLLRIHLGAVRDLYRFLLKLLRIYLDFSLGFLLKLLKISVDFCWSCWGFTFLDFCWSCWRFTGAVEDLYWFLLKLLKIYRGCWRFILVSVEVVGDFRWSCWSCWGFLLKLLGINLDFRWSCWGFLSKLLGINLDFRWSCWGFLSKLLGISVEVVGD